jgi:hypothetical protein
MCTERKRERESQLISSHVCCRLRDWLAACIEPWGQPYTESETLSPYLHHTHPGPIHGAVNRWEWWLHPENWSRVLSIGSIDHYFMVLLETIHHSAKGRAKRVIYCRFYAKKPELSAGAQSMFKVFGLTHTNLLLAHSLSESCIKWDMSTYDRKSRTVVRCTMHSPSQARSHIHAYALDTMRTCPCRHLRVQVFVITGFTAYYRRQASSSSWGLAGCRGDVSDTVWRRRRLGDTSVMRLYGPW